MLVPKINISENLLRNRYTSEIEKYSWLSKLSHIDGFILGSSSLHYGVSCKELSRDNETWVNLSNDARDPVMYYLLLERWAIERKPKIVLVGLDPWIFSKSYYKNRDYIMYADFTVKEKLLYCINEDKLMPFKMYNNLYHILCYNAKVNNNNPVSSKDTIPEDFGSDKLTTTGMKYQEADRDKFQIEKYGWSDMEFEYLAKIKELCKKNNIKLIFVIPPRRKNFIDYANSKFIKQNVEWWNRLDKVVNGEYVVGHYSDLKGLNQESVFSEAYHLNSYGQNLFSKILRHEIDSPRLISDKFDIF